MKKWLSRIFLALVGIFLLVVGLGYFVKKEWSKTVDRISVSEGALHFEAHRDPTGVWVIQAPNEDSLFFATGYIQAIDREFQTEALRLVAQGRGSELLGKGALSFSRLMRFSSKVAEEEWAHRDPQRGLYRALDLYAQGRNLFLKKNPVPEPVEFKLLGLQRAKLEAWTGLDALKIARYHTWEFSYDYNEVLRDMSLKDLLGQDLSSLLIQRGDAPLTPLYGQAKARGVLPRLSAANPSRIPESFYDALPSTTASAPAPTSGEALASSGHDWEAPFGAGWHKGASNLWMVADPARLPTPTFCNDTHLRHYWPSPLYPYRYEISGGLRAAGFALPGLPFLTIGSVDHPGQQRKFVWGITIATFADTQDLVHLDPQTLKKSKKFTESYVIREPLSEKAEVVERVEEWTPYGPRVDEVVPWMPGKAQKNVALDWMGYRRLESPMEFFYRRSVRGEENLERDLAEVWKYPSVNFAWMAQRESQPVHFGHAMTGIIFQRDQSERKILSEAEAGRRAYSFPANRPYLSYDYREQESFLAVSGNQKVFSDELGNQLAFDWLDGSRARRIYEVLDQNPGQAEAEQTDSFMPSVFQFVKTQRRQFSVDELCAYADDRETCYQRVADLDAWDGRGTANSKEAPLAAMWFMESQWDLLPPGLTDNFSQQSEDVRALLVRWINAANTPRLPRLLSSQADFRARWEKVSHRKWSEVVKKAFLKTINLVGPTSDFLDWSVVHRISWTHPIGKVPGDFGKVLKESLLGDSPFVAGGFDSPGRSDIAWDPSDPVMFPNTHGAAMRMCRSFLSSKGGHDLGLRWTNVTGPSGNPYSPWSRKFSEDYYLKGKLFRLEGF